MSRSPDPAGRARDLLAERLSEESYAHCERTAKVAVVLAERFGVDGVSAELAGLLHDYARDDDPSKLAEAAAGLDVPVTPFESEHPHLLHARVGAAMARRDVPGLGEAVLSAIEVHTVGGVPMSDLDKIVYLADMTEPGRDFPGVDDLRDALEHETLDECFRLAYGRTLRHLQERGRPVHPISATVSVFIERETGRALFDPRSAAGDEPAGGGVETAHATHGRRRRFGRSYRAHAGSSPSHARHVDAPGGLPPRLVRIARVAGSVVLIATVLLGALWGLALGVNAFARWNLRRIAARTTPVGAVSENLLVIGVRDGTAIGFTALKVERANDRVLGIAIPDGAFVEVPGQGFERIGESFTAGPAVSKAAVSNYFAVGFTRYLVVDGDAYQALLQDQNIGAMTARVSSTDLSATEQASLYAFLRKVSVDDVWIVPLPVKAMTVGTERYFEPQRAQVADLLLQWWGVRIEQQKARPRVIVYNGVGTPGLASEAAQQLIGAGFRVVDSGNADNFGYARTTILVYHAPSEAQAVRDALGVGEIKMQSAPQELTDMIVIIGADYLPPVSTPSSATTEGAR